MIVNPSSLGLGHKLRHMTTGDTTPVSTPDCVQSTEIKVRAIENWLQ